MSKFANLGFNSAISSMPCIFVPGSCNNNNQSRKECGRGGGGRTMRENNKTKCRDVQHRRAIKQIANPPLLEVADELSDLRALRYFTCRPDRRDRNRLRFQSDRGNGRQQGFRQIRERTQ